MSVNFLTYFEAYIKLYQKKDVRVIEMALREFKNSLPSNTLISSSALNRLR